MINKLKKEGEKIMNCFKNQLAQSKVRSRLQDTEIDEIIDKLLRGEFT